MNLITCISLNHCIGKDGKLVTRIPEDLARFQKLTTDNIVVMGANTFFGDLGGKPLKDRVNIVLTSKVEFSTIVTPNSEILVRDSVDKLKELLPFVQNKYPTKKVFCIGGAAVYQALLPRVNTMYVTHTNSIIREGDTYFNVDWSEWEIEEIEFTDKCTFAKYVRN